MTTFVALSVRPQPADDDAFHDAAWAALAPVDPDGGDADIARTIEAALKPAYPSVRAVPVDRLATLPNERAWYVFRDGRPGDGRSKPAPAAPEHARAPVMPES